MGVSEIVLLVLCLMAGVIVQRVTGMGSNLVIAPFLILIFGPVGGVVLVNMVGAVIAAILTAQLRQGIDRPVFVRLLAGALVGCVPGVLVVRAMPEELLTPLIGAILLLGLVLSRALAGRFARDFAHEGRSGLAVGAGFLSGATNVVSGAGGPPIAVFALMGVMFFFPQYLMLVRGMGAAQAGLWLLPLALSTIVGSLTSPLADDELRSQWRDVRDRFLALDTVMGRIGDLRPDSPDSEFRAHAADIDTAHETVDQMETAEKNIDELFRMEQGDADARRRQLGELHEDMLAAALGTKDSRLAAEARALDARGDELARDTAAPDFMDRYARLVVDYRIVVEAIRAAEMSDVEVADDAGDRRPPRLYDRDWRVGYGYQGFVPYYVVSSWHAHDVQAAQAAASSATNTSYSNASFSGGGGSSGY